MNDQRIKVRFPAERRRRLKDVAPRGGTRESKIIRQSIERQLNADDNAPTTYELAKMAGLIGAVRYARPDLSTNRKYLDGFGGFNPILARHGDLRIQLADAALVHLAKREGINTTFILDRRDFQVLRPARGKKFRLIP